MTSEPSVQQLAVIVPHYDDRVRLRRCLDALVPQCAGQPVELVVVDNATPGGLDDIAAAFPHLRIVTEPRKGAAAARNRGVAETTAPWLAFLDCDCVPAPDWVATCRALAAGPERVIGGRVDVFDETPPPRSGAEAFETVFAFHQKSYIETKGFSVTANLVTPRRIFADTGPLIVGLSEDMDWCRRATARGHALVYDDALRVAHPTRQDWRALRRKWQRTTAEMFHLHGTGGAARAGWALRALAVLASGPAHLPRVLRAPQLSRVEKLRGAGMLLRLRGLRAWWMLGQALRGA